MKNISKYIVLALALVASACKKDILDKVPKDAISEVVVWKDATAATAFINGIYGKLPSGFDRNYQGWYYGVYILDATTDDGEVCMPWTSAQQLQNGDFLPSGVPFDELWGNFYSMIRMANVALANLDKISDETARQKLKGETYFLRAYAYHELLRTYGGKQPWNSEPTGVPIIDKPLGMDDNLQIPRSTYDQTVDFILSDLDKATALLPGKGKTDAGRATKGAALALKGRVLMYAERWAQSADASAKVMTEGYSLFPDYRTLFLTKNNDEIIYAKKFKSPDKTSGFDIINSPRSFKGASDAGWGGTVPTQNFVDAYEMKDGLPQSTSPLFDPNNPFNNLDPRFEATVVHNGSTFRNHVMEMYPGGADVTGQPEDSKTGYQLRKLMTETSQLYPTPGDNDWPLIRYGEILLNFAEAKNEASGPVDSVYNAINLIRRRAGMPDLMPGLSKAQMRDKIRNERRVELAFEEHRFFDIRRWGIAESLLNGPLWGLKYTKTPGGITYTRYQFEDRKFPSKLYVLPIPQREIDKNPAAKQIYGW